MEVKYLFKFLNKQQYAADMVRLGRIMIGTDASYRAIEHDQERGDNFEGNIDLSYQSGSEPFSSQTHYDYLRNLGIGIAPNSTNMFISGMTVLGSPYYIYCMSMENGSRLAKSFDGVACVQNQKAASCRDEDRVRLVSRKAI